MKVCLFLDPGASTRLHFLRKFWFRKAKKISGDHTLVRDSSQMHVIQSRGAQ